MRVRRARAGYTILELVLASAIGSVVTMAAVAFTAHQTRQYGVTNEQLEMAQGTRAALDRLKADLRLAGTGIGYRENGEFAGLEIGNFSRGGASFGSHNKLISNDLGNTFTDDIGIVAANGEYATIAHFSAAGWGQICRNSGIKSGEIVLLRSEDGLNARTVLMGSMQNALCELGQCAGGCDTFNYTADASFVSGQQAVNAAYSGGEMASKFQQITWFVESTDPDAPNAGRLRRVVGNCPSRNHSCGEEVLDNVESVQMRVYQRNRSGWTDHTTKNGALLGADRIRVDIELIVRGRTDYGEKDKKPVASTLEPNLCYPACGTQDGFVRRVIRSSVEVRNSGRVSYYRSDS